MIFTNGMKLWGPLRLIAFGAKPGLLIADSIADFAVGLARRKSRNVIDAFRSPARERRDVTLIATFSLSSRSGLQSKTDLL